MSRKQVGKYLLDRRIGKGSYAQVWLGHCEDTHETVAVKVISRHTVNETAQLRQEVAVLKKINHDNIVKFRDLKKSVGHYYLVLEYCEGGDLARFIQRHGRMSEVSARRFLQQLSAGLMVLHRLSFIHRDLKPQNILMTVDSEDAVLKIADFGFARVLDSTDMAATVCGSPLYMAPEILRHERYDARADLWSLGTILYELLFGQPPYTGSNPMQLLANIETAPSRLTVFPQSDVSLQCKSFLEVVLVRDPIERISPEQFFAHEYNLGPEVSRTCDSSPPEIADDDLTLIEETSPVHISESPLPQIAEPVVVLSGISRVLSEALSLQTQGPLADTYASTQTALGMLLRSIALEIVEKSSEDTEESTAVDALGLVGRSCEFLDGALDEVVDKQAVLLVELELKQSLEAAALIQSRLSYRGFTENAKPLRWVYAFVLKLLKQSQSECGDISSSETKQLLIKGAVLLIDFLVHDLDQLEPHAEEEQVAKGNSLKILNSLRCEFLQ